MLFLYISGWHGMAIDGNNAGKFGGRVDMIDPVNITRSMMTSRAGARIRGHRHYMRPSDVRHKFAFIDCVTKDANGR